MPWMEMIVPAWRASAFARDSPRGGHDAPTVDERSGHVDPTDGERLGRGDALAPAAPGVFDHRPAVLILEDRRLFRREEGADGLRGQQESGIRGVHLDLRHDR